MNVTTEIRLKFKDRDTLADLAHWFGTQCDGTWEHSYGIEIDTLDNPGWTVKIDVAGTPIENKPFLSICYLDEEEDWLICEVKEKSTLLLVGHQCYRR